MMRGQRFDVDDTAEESSAYSTEPVAVLRSAGHGTDSSRAGNSELAPNKGRDDDDHRIILQTPLSASHQDKPSAFVWDNAKRWWNFGSGTVDKTAGPAWVPDESVQACTGCNRDFDFFNRRHHCRHCGQIFCANCSSSYRLLPVEFGVREPQRTCRSCAAELEPLQEELGRTITNQTRTVHFDPDAPSKYISAPVSFSMSAEITKAAHAMENIFGHVPNSLIRIDRSIPETLIRMAKGIAFLTVLKGGFLVSGKIGSGLVVAKLESTKSGIEWSAPSAIGTMGIGWGAQIGGEITEFVVVLTTTDALDAFSGRSQVAIGAELGISVGPFGRTGEASLNFGDQSLAPVYAYSQSSGLFAGISLEGAVITTRSDVNRRFYGKDISTRDILSGIGVAPPPAALPLYQAIQKFFAIAHCQQSIGTSI